ncbi:hypothetical protein [Flammeovirga kamogawensis]|uniref:Uncharacterized protein n=1 Tax=Flammeovirga kamogawensis TaxID=373891 RepID=A0ABX8GS88_9BACT|nr:hypothetical protein [Flammeovirga kamogawensis]MBB6464005.1 hypothetical protein [Flammeovirga kamogawensis]QWG06117.1 hypothetical protein KM029_12215 [Flammeovirga kamogawensis]TRX67949.1 hypothetical protein EO216_07240 [Flammeovirga kamogawensis]
MTNSIKILLPFFILLFCSFAFNIHESEVIHDINKKDILKESNNLSILMDGVQVEKYSDGSVDLYIQS